MKKPIRQWLETIADKEIREAAISQIDEGYGDYQVHSLLRAVGGFNLWVNTKEGWKYWNNVSIQAKNGTLETREVDVSKNNIIDDWLDKNENTKPETEAGKMKEGYIPYSNEQEREWAIAQAERMGYKKWDSNDSARSSDDCCIRICSDGDWFDFHRNEEKLIPLEIPEEATKPKKDPSDLDDGTWLKSPNFLAENTEVTVTAYISKEFLGNDKTEILTFQKGTLLANQISVFNINPDNYTKTEESDGTIILKPKNRKVWIEVYFSAIDDSICATEHLSKKGLKESIEVGKRNGETLLEVIERTYKIENQ